MKLRNQYQLWCYVHEGWTMVGFYDTLQEAENTIRQFYRTAEVLETKIVRVAVFE